MIISRLAVPARLSMRMNTRGRNSGATALVCHRMRSVVLSASLLLAVAIPSHAAERLWRYEVSLPRAGALEIEASLPESGAAVRVGEGMSKFVDAMRVETNNAWA